MLVQHHGEQLVANCSLGYAHACFLDLLTHSFIHPSVHLLVYLSIHSSFSSFTTEFQVSGLSPALEVPMYRSRDAHIVLTDQGPPFPAPSFPPPLFSRHWRPGSHFCSPELQHPDSRARDCHLCQAEYGWHGDTVAAQAEWLWQRYQDWIPYPIGPRLPLISKGEGWLRQRL